MENETMEYKFAQDIATISAIYSYLKTEEAKAMIGNVTAELSNKMQEIMKN